MGKNLREVGRGKKGGNNINKVLMDKTQKNLNKDVLKILIPDLFLNCFKFW